MDIRHAIETLTHDPDFDVANIALEVLISIEAAAEAARPDGEMTRDEFEQYVDATTAPGTYARLSTNAGRRLEQLKGRAPTPAEILEEVGVAVGVYAARYRPPQPDVSEAFDRFNAKVKALIRRPSAPVNVN